MKKKFQLSIVLLFVALVGTSCTSINKSMKETQPLVGFNKADFTLSDQVSAEASQTKILGIDFERLFMRKTGTAISGAQVSVIGSLLQNQASAFALEQKINLILIL